MFKTEKKAREYGDRIKTMTGKTHMVFKVPGGTSAAAMGYKFATCEESERAAYEKDGAVFVKEAPPKESYCGLCRTYDACKHN